MPAVVKHILLAALLLACSACARFENPIVAEEGPRFDDRLAGLWHAEGKDGTVDMEIRRAGEEGLVVMSTTEAGQEPKSEDFRLVTARLERQTFASVTDPAKKEANWVLFRYDVVSPDLLILYVDKGAAWDDAVKNKLLPGKADESGTEGSKVTASSQQLREFVLGYGSVVFDDQPAVEFRRVPAD